MKKLEMEDLLRIKSESGIATALRSDAEEGMTIIVHMGTCGIASGAGSVMNALREIVTQKGLEIHLDEAGCIGICEREPIVSVVQKGKPIVRYEKVSPGSIREIVESHVINGKPLDDHLLLQVQAGPDSPVESISSAEPASPPTSGEHPDDLAKMDFFLRQRRITRSNCGRINPYRIDEYIAVGGWSALARALREMTPEEVIEEVRSSGLRGRGGAGFPTGIKWRLCREAAGTVKYILCNADEGDPGAYMDRAQLEGDPQSILEGMAVGAYAIGAGKGIVYIRMEYPLAVELISHAIDQAHDYGLLGEDIFGTGFDFDVEIMTGAGAFVCGEETALIHSVQGQRGVPRPKPPFPASSGLYRKPTVINNVETLATVPIILRNGGPWYSAIGTGKSKGTKIFSLAGSIVNNGLVEVEMGTPMGEIIHEIGGGVPQGGTFKAVQCGGPSGGCISRNHLNTPIDYESLTELGAIMGSGGLVVMDDNSCMVDTARFFIEFVQEESCGQCTPCREGTGLMLEILTRITEGKGKEGDIEELEKLGNIIKKTALCGLGQTASNPVLSTIRHFREEYDAHIREKRCPAAVCEMLFRAPCEHTCPVGLDVSGYNALIAGRRFREAFDLIMERNPLPGVCGRVCTHPCERKCRRAQIDEPVAVRALKRFVSDTVAAENGGPRTDEPRKPVNRDGDAVAVIGSGPAGLTAAYHLSRKGRSVVVFEKLPVEGGVLAAGIPAYRLPSDVLRTDIGRIKEYGVEIRTGVEVGKDVTVDGLFDQGFKAVFVAIGAWKGMNLMVEGEHRQGVYPALRLLCDYNLGRDVRVGRSAAVIGGGNAAIDAARTLVRLGCEEVSLVYRRTRAEMPAVAEEVEEAFNEGVKPYFLSEPVRILGENGKVSELDCRRMRPGPFDSSGRRTPVSIEGAPLTLKVDTVVKGIGQIPDAAGLISGSHIDTTRRGTIHVDPTTYATSREGVFAGGDAVGEDATVIQAMKSGMRAAMEIDKYLGGDGRISECVRSRAGIDEMMPSTSANIEVIRRERQDRLSVADRKGNFKETELGFDEAAAVREAARCLRCDFGKGEERGTTAFHSAR